MSTGVLLSSVFVLAVLLGPCHATWPLPWLDHPWGACPPQGFDSVADLNLTKYIAAPWYVQAQIPVSYQPPEDLYCVRAIYEPVNPANLTAGLIVNNYANHGGVGGEALGTSNATGGEQLRAVPAKPNSTSRTATSKLLVGPLQLQQRLPEQEWRKQYGPYWVVAVGQSNNETIGYDWAIISGGAPRIHTLLGCITGGLGIPDYKDASPNVAGEGLWLFSRRPVDTRATLVMKHVAQGLGFVVTLLLPVQQEGCSYE